MLIGAAWRIFVSLLATLKFELCVKDNDEVAHQQLPSNFAISYDCYEAEPASRLYEAEPTRLYEAEPAMAMIIKLLLVLRKDLRRESGRKGEIRRT